MFESVAKGEGAYIAGLRLLQLRMFTIYKLSIACDYREHTDSFDPRKRHLE